MGFIFAWNWVTNQDVFPMPRIVLGEIVIQIKEIFRRLAKVVSFQGTHRHSCCCCCCCPCIMTVIALWDRSIRNWRRQGHRIFQQTQFPLLTVVDQRQTRRNLNVWDLILWNVAQMHQQTTNRISKHTKKNNKKMKRLDLNQICATIQRQFVYIIW